MKYVFWQNMIAIHQVAFLNELAEKHDVVLIVEEEVYAERKRQGWNVPDTSGLELHVAPSRKDVEDIIAQNKTSIHVFSSIYAFKTVYFAFQLARREGCKIFVMMEPYNSKGWKGGIRKLLWWCMQRMYADCIDAILATGDLGVSAYRQVGFPVSKIYEWGYFTDDSKSTQVKTQQKTKPIVLYVGQLIHRKNIVALLQNLCDYYESCSEIRIIGDGPLQDKVFSIGKRIPNISYFSCVSNELIRKHMSESDLLILPSNFDGWGAVVNEALQEGCRVLCSDLCGASSLLDGVIRGGFFKISSSSDFKEKIKFWIDKGVVTEDERRKISSWAQENISGRAAEEYFNQIVSHVYSDAIYEHPQPPWKGDCL